MEPLMNKEEFWDALTLPVDFNKSCDNCAYYSSTGICMTAKANVCRIAAKTDDNTPTTYWKMKQVIIIP